MLKHLFVPLGKALLSLPVPVAVLSREPFIDPCRSLDSASLSFPSSFVIYIQLGYPSLSHIMANSSRKSSANGTPRTRSSPRLVRGRRGTPEKAAENTEVDTRMDEVSRLPVSEALTSESTSLDARKVQSFMKMTQQAMQMLMREHGFSPLRAQRTLLDYLVQIHGADSSPLSDMEIFDCMRLHHIGMEQAAIALTIEKAITCLLNASQSASSASINRVLDEWTESLKQVKPLPVRETLVFPDSSATVLPKTQSTLFATVAPPEPKWLPSPSTGVPSTPTPGAILEQAAPSTSRSKTSKKPSKVAASTPPMTITTTQRTRSDSVLEAVSSKLTGSVDTDTNGALKGKPPLAPVTATLGTASSASASSKRVNSMLGDALMERPATPPSSASHKRQRRASGAN